jgi:choline dehydrogenase-like flavoprotein
MNWGYKTESQEFCLNREMDYSRGRALGGSSTINSGVYTIGAKGDYDEWARIVGNDAFKWENMQRRSKELETFHNEVPRGGERYATPRAPDHGHSGPIHVGYSREWEKDLIPLLGIFEQAEFPLNKDHNSGNPIGMSVMVNSAHRGIRTTAADALILHADNLTIRSQSIVQRLIIERKKVRRVECDGNMCMCGPLYSLFAS